MSSIDKISADLKLAEFKLLDLRKSFEHLKSQPSPVSSITLQWQHIETHFNSLRSSLNHRLLSLKSRQQQQQQHDEDRNEPSNDVGIESKAIHSGDLTTIQSLCLNMDSEGLRLYLNDREEEHELMREELSAALKLSPDAAKLVLDAVKGFYMRDAGDKLSVVRKSCVLLLEELMGLSLEIGSDVKEEAMKMANEWKEKLVDDKSERSVGVLGFLLLLGAFGLRKGFRKKKLLGLLECVCRRKEVPELVRLLGLVKKIPKLIQNLVDKKLHLEAIRYIYAFELADKFSPVPILEDHLEHSKRIAKKIRKRNSHGSENKATTKEVSALRAVIQCIKYHNLESVFSPKILEERIMKLEKEVCRKHILAAVHPNIELQEQCGKKPKLHTASSPSLTPSPILSHTAASILSHTPSPASVPDPKAQPQQQCGNNYLNTNVSVSATPNAHFGAASTIHATQPQYWQLAGVFPGNTAVNFSGSRSVTQPMSLSAGPYSFSGSHAIPLHTGSAAGNYPFGFAGNVNTEQYQCPGTYVGFNHGSSFNPPVPYYLNNAFAAPGSYNRPTSGSVHGLPPQFHPAYR